MAEKQSVRIVSPGAGSPAGLQAPARLRVLSARNVRDPLRLEMWGQFAHSPRHPCVLQGVRQAVKAAENHEPYVDLPTGVDPTEVKAILDREYPELFMLDSHYSYIFDGGVSRIIFQYTCGREEARKLRNKMDVEVRALVYEAKKRENPVEQLRCVHDWFARNVRYHYEKPRPMGDYTPVNVFTKRLAVCSGFTEAFQLICRRLGIDSGYVHGSIEKNGKPNHAWNAVWLDGSVYHIDLTSAICFFEQCSRVAYPCFLQTTERVLRGRDIVSPFTPRDNEEGNYLARGRWQFDSRRDLEMLLRRVYADPSLRTVTIQPGLGCAWKDADTVKDEVLRAMSDAGRYQDMLSYNNMGVCTIMKHARPDPGTRIRVVKMKTL